MGKNPKMNMGADLDYVMMANSNRQMYVAHVNEGFTEEQAMDLVRTMMSTHLQTTMIIEAGQEAEDGTD